MKRLIAVKDLKVGKWWFAFDDKQQEAFKRLYVGICKQYGYDRYDVNPLRVFITSAKKNFGSDIEYLKLNLIKTSDGRYMYYNHDRKSWRELDWYAE